MSVILKTREVKFKDSSGNYYGVNAIAEKKIQDQIDDLNTVCSQVEAQKNIMIASIASIAGQGTDTTLTQSGVAADAKVAGDEISDLKSAFTVVTGNVAIPITATNSYIPLANSKFDYENPTGSANFNYYLVPCYAGAVFTVSAEGGSTPRAWAFIDSSKNALLYADANSSATDLVLTAPTNSAFLIINDKKSGGVSYYGDRLQGYVSKIKKDVNRLNSYNLIDYRALAERTQSGIKYTSTGSVLVVNGTSTSASYYNLRDDPTVLPEGTSPGEELEIRWYSRNDNIYLRIYYYDSNGISSSALISTNEDTTVKIPDNAIGLLIRLWVANGTTISNAIIYCSVSHASNRALSKLLKTTSGVLLTEKKIAFFGDSNMWGRDGSGSASARVATTIPMVVEKRTGAKCDNYGVSGMGYLRPEDGAGGTGMIAYDKIASTDITGYDVIVLAFGGNDGFFNPGDWNSTDLNTCLGQFNKIINYIYTQNESCQVIVFAPLNGSNVGSFPDYWYGDVTDPDAGSQHQGRWSRMELNNALKHACEYYWIPYFEVFDSPINSKTVTLLPDGVHLTQELHEKVGNWYAAKIGTII